MHQVSGGSHREVCQARCALGAEELEGVGVDDTVVAASIVESIALYINIVSALRKSSPNSILADGILQHLASWVAHSSHDEGTWCILAWEEGSAGSKREVRDGNHVGRLVSMYELLWVTERVCCLV